jgi:hypothetical protein
MTVLQYFLIPFLVIVAAFAMNSEIVLPYVLAQHPEHPVFHGSRTVAGLHLELTVEPVPIEPGVLTKFGTIFTDAATGEPMLEVPHTFVLVKDDHVIFRESIKSASYIHEFSFAEEHQGQLNILIENVNDSGENIEFSLMIIPEFPLGSVFAMTAMLAIMFTILRFRNIWKPRT